MRASPLIRALRTAAPCRPRPPLPLPIAGTPLAPTAPAPRAGFASTPRPSTFCSVKQMATSGASSGEGETSSSSSSSSSPSSSAPERETRTLLIVYHSLTDGARQMAAAAADAARAAAQDEWDAGDGEPAPEIEVRLVSAREAGPEDILSAAGYLFAAPENLATLAGVMKDFFDRSYYHVLGKANGRPYGVMICAGSDGEGAMRQLDRICTGWRLKKVAEGIIVITHAQTAETCLAIKTIKEDELDRCRELGGAMVEGLRMGVW